MTSETIKGSEHRLHKVFSDDFAFEIPGYQRPYAWKQQQAEELLSDLLAAVGDDDNVSIDRLSPYFLGSIVLIRKDEKSNAEVVDGQQRLTTLTILLAALRHVIQDPQTKSAISPFIMQKGSPVLGTPDRPRLSLRPRDAEFFRQYIQDEGGMDGLLQLQTKPESEAQENIRDNARRLVGQLEKVPDKRRCRLVSFMMQRCFLVVVSTSNLDSAFRIFSVLNDRGLDLAVSDIIKSDILSRISGEGTGKDQHYQQKWEEVENSLGREQFQAFFNHMRMIHSRRKLHGTVLSEFREHVLKPVRDMGDFLDKTFFPYADAFEAILRSDYQASDSTESQRINRILNWLSYIDNVDWMPPAILYLKKHSQKPQLLAAFFSGLERLAVVMMLLRYTINDRIERYARLLEAIDTGADLQAPSSPLQLTDEERSEGLAVIGDDIYNAYHTVRKLVLYRLDAELSAGGATYDHDKISIEHVLPQTVKPGSAWEKLFPDANERAAIVHRLGNLVLLTRRKNSQASNYDFETKKDKYFSTKSGVANFALTNTVLKLSSWDKKTFEARQDELVKTLQSVWQL